MHSYLCQIYLSAEQVQLLLPGAKSSVGGNVVLLEQASRGWAHVEDPARTKHAGDIHTDIRLYMQDICYTHVAATTYAGYMHSQ